MEKQTKISVVMPVYNCGKYLRESIDSLINQSFKDMELICVDDASDDFETRQILSEYSEKNMPFHFEIIMLNERTGAANARNLGFKNAKGIYTIFLDADDFFDRSFLERMYTAAMNRDADVCVCGFTEFYCGEDGKYKMRDRITLERNAILDRTREEWAVKNPCIPWNKLCKTNYLRKNKIYFQNLSSCNDVFFSIMVMDKANIIEVIEANNLIYYRINTGVQISSNRNPVNLYYAIELIQKNITNNSNSKITVKQCAALLVWGMNGEISRSKSIVRSKELYEKVRLFLINNSFVFENKLLEKWKQNAINLPFESNLYTPDDVFLEQLELYEKEIINELGNNKDIYLWGNGKRGIAFQKFCLKQDINLKGVIDKKNDDVGNRTQQGYMIISTDDIIYSTGLIVASNEEIFREIRKTVKNYKIINLQDFCPI